MRSSTPANDEKWALRVHLSNLPDSSDVDAQDLAILMKCCVKHIERLVERGLFPRPHFFGGKRLWNLGMVRRFMLELAEAAQVNE